MTNRRNSQAVLLALLPMAFALVGGLVDERTHFGFTSWRSACRAVGFTLTSLFTFTWELLPNAILGALAGGVVLLFLGATLLPGRDGGRATLAAHAGCAFAMAAGLLLCAWIPSIPLMLGAEAVLAGGTVLLLCRHRGRVCRVATSVELPESAHTNAY